jgi:hypothetical protein
MPPLKALLAEQFHKIQQPERSGHMAKPVLDVDADASLAQAKKSSPKFKKLLEGAHAAHAAHGSVREVDHKGHKISIRTTYEIRVDGKKFDAPLEVSIDGDVSYMGLMNASFASAVDLVKAAIDQYPESFKKTRPAPGGGQGGHGHHDPSHAPKRARKAAKKARR